MATILLFFKSLETGCTPRQLGHFLLPEHSIWRYLRRLLLCYKYAILQIEENNFFRMGNFVAIQYNRRLFKNAAIFI